MTATTKTRRGLKIRQQPATPPKPTAQEEQLKAFEMLDEITDIVCGAIEISEDGTHVWRAMTIASDQFLMPSLGLLQPGDRVLSDKEASLIVDRMHDADAILLGIQARCTSSRLRSIGVLVGEASARLDELRDLLSQQGMWPEANPAHEFIAGRDVVLDMLRDLQKAGTDDSPDAWRVFRRGGIQNRFAQPHLEKLIANPSLLDGFSALLSAWMYQSAEGYPNIDRLIGIPPEEFQAGVPGEDGTSTKPYPCPEDDE